MPDDPAQCRQHARECSEMASRASNPDHKKILTNLARTWLSLAIELESSSPLLDTYPQPKGPRPREPSPEGRGSPVRAGLTYGLAR
jgi:hypothetical protein